MTLRYKIEYLLNPLDETSVCHVKSATGRELNSVLEEAHFYARTVARIFGARGFQIREQTERGAIVAQEAFDS